MQNSRQYSFISDIWTIGFNPNSPRKNCLWDMIKIDWKEVFVTLNGTIVRMAKMVKVPLRDKYRLRTLMDKHSLLLHVMLRQGTSWYALDKTDSEILLPPPLQGSEI